MKNEMELITIRQLRWATIVVPVVFLALFTYIAHFVFSGFLHSAFGFSLMLGLSSIAAFVFSHVVFGLMQRLEEQVLAQNRELSVVSTIATALSEPLGLEQALQVSLDTAIEVMGANAGVICILDVEREELHSAAHRGLSPAVVEHVRRQKLGDDPIGAEVVRGGMPVVIANAFDDPRVAELCRREGYRSTISVPIKSQGKVVGVLALASPNEAAFGDAKSDLLERIGQQVGIAIEKATLFRALVQRNRDLTALNEVAAAVSRSLDLEGVTSAALSGIPDFAGASSGDIWLVDKEKACLVMVGHQGESPRIPMKEGICGLAARSGKPELLRRETDGGAVLQAAVPLKSGGETIGLLSVDFSDRRALLEREIQMLESLASQLAVAIRNAQLHQRMQDMAILEERDRIAREMHDGFAQVLGYVNTKAFAVRQLLMTGKTEEASELVAQLEEAAREVYGDVREAIMGLRATARNDGGLVPQIVEYLDTFGRLAGLKTNCHMQKGVDELRLPVAAEIQVIRIIQEALTNVRKHAEAKDVEIDMAVKVNRLRVSVTDNGRGFDPNDFVRGDWPQFGLQTMRERAEAVGGRLRIQSPPGRGTRVTVSIPLNGAKGGNL